LLRYVNTKKHFIMNSKTLTLTGEAIPQALREIPSPPNKLYLQGEIEPINELPLLAVVGSRKVSHYGREVTSRLVREVAGKGVGIVSGLALGVDGLAHTAALEAKGYTLAVMPCGLGEIYPKTHYHMGKQIIASGGALLSEYPEGAPPLRQNFIERNRLVSGIAHAVLITEAAERSGTLHTANFALDQGKTVLVVPGNITSDLSRGTNNLLKAGATAVTTASDILLALGVDETHTQKELFGDNPEESTILALIQSGITDGAELQKMSKLTPSVFSQTITMLEINDKLACLGGSQWRIK
jgi:DNA processing protein